MSESIKRYIEEVKRNVRFDIDHEYCEKIGFKFIDNGIDATNIGFLSLICNLKFYDKFFYR